MVTTDYDGLKTDYDGLEKEFKIILDYLMTNNTIQTKIVKEKLDIMDTKAKEILKEMIKKNLIEKKGKGSATHYIIKK
ncbi:MAG: hypothetical protein WBG30_13815 [Psychrilyobacter sp.]|uniref:hypothetical protein n=1 Tax=Psychrilyobacter sp. TaxID=2586924 RepID=UPI003C72E0CD